MREIQEIKVVVFEDGSKGYYAVDGDYETEIYYRKKDLLKDLVKKPQVGCLGISQRIDSTP